MVLFSWVLVESAVCNSIVQGGSTSSPKWEKLNANFLPEPTGLKSSRVAVFSIELLDTRIALCFLVLINVAFFGTGNMASVASFEISSVYRFITIFNPYIMGALLLCKLFVPFILVTCAFSAVTRVLELPRLGCYFIVLLLSDVMTIHFFFLVSLPTFFPSRFHQCFALYLIALHLHEDQWRNLLFCSAICTD
jgi:phosphatidylinositol glycan class N